jgi:6-pyruvoyltetrahydropterin/6-carboxytetrahydropterin synthase
MFSITAKAHFDSAHFLSEYEGKCANIHGHRWVFEAEIAGGLIAFGEEKQMVTDFAKLREALDEIAENFDHTLIYEDGTLSDPLLDALDDDGFSVCPVDFRPTAESFAYNIFNELKDRRFDVSRVTVWETPETSATYIAPSGNVEDCEF